MAKKKREEVCRRRENGTHAWNEGSERKDWRNGRQVVLV